MVSQIQNSYLLLSFSIGHHLTCSFLVVSAYLYNSSLCTPSGILYRSCGARKVCTAIMQKIYLIIYAKNIRNNIHIHYSPICFLRILTSKHRILVTSPPPFFTKNIIFSLSHAGNPNKLRIFAPCIIYKHHGQVVTRHIDPIPPDT